MKKFLSVIITLLLAFSMPAVAFAAGTVSYSVDGMNYTSQLRSDGTALVTEEWTVTFSGSASDGFTRELPVETSALEGYKSISDLSVSVDGDKCSQTTDDNVRDGTFILDESEKSAYKIVWNIQSQDVTRTFSLRYVLNGIVKNHDGKAVVYFNILNSDSKLLCHNVSVKVLTPSKCFPEDFTILEAGALAGEKSENGVTFSSANTMGAIKTGITMPLNLFDGDITYVAVKSPVNYTALTVILVILGILLILIVVSLVRFRTIFKKHYEKKCRKNAFSEGSYKAQNAVLNVISPAEVLKTILPDMYNKSDHFTVTLLDLFRRGYLTESAGEFTVHKKSEADSYKRPLAAHEKEILDVFRSEKRQDMLTNPLEFYTFIKKYNKKVPCETIIRNLVPSNRRMYMRCFEIKMAASSHEYVSPCEVSDYFFRNDKYSIFDLLISVINEYRKAGNPDYIPPDTEKFMRNIFMFREVYNDGERQYNLIRSEKKNKHRSVKTDDNVSE